MLKKRIKIRIKKRIKRPTLANLKAGSKAPSYYKNKTGVVNSPRPGLKKTFFQHKKAQVLKKRLRKVVRKPAIIQVQCSNNNTIIHTQCGVGGFVVSTGTVGLTGARRSSFYASQQAAGQVVRTLKPKRYDSAFLCFTGFNRGRRAILRAFKKKIKILQIFDTTTISHNGCRAPKQRRH